MTNVTPESTLSAEGPDMPRKLEVNFLLGMPVRTRGPAYTAVKIAETLQAPGLSSRIFGHPHLWPRPLDIPVLTRSAFPGEKLAARSRIPFIQHQLREVAARRLLRWLDEHGTDGQCVYTWGETSFATIRALHARGVPTVREKFNCAKAVAREILSKSYAMLNAPRPVVPSEKLIAKEAEEMRLADAIFCPSPMVTRSLIDIGVPPEKLIATSYGWEPERFQGSDRTLPDFDGPTFLFVGLVCVRKGAHILLDAWKRAGAPGRLVLLGNIEPLIAERYRDVLALPSVKYMTFTPDVGGIFRSADWFVFPTLEEGGPQVTYEAGGCGVPSIVSDMGAGAFTRQGVEGEILSVDGPDAPDIWADALIRLGQDHDRRAQWGENARMRAAEFTWDKVGARRAAALYARFSGA